MSRITGTPGRKPPLVCTGCIVATCSGGEQSAARALNRALWATNVTPRIGASLRPGETSGARPDNGVRAVVASSAAAAIRARLQRSASSPGSPFAYPAASFMPAGLLPAIAGERLRSEA